MMICLVVRSTTNPPAVEDVGRESETSASACVAGTESTASLYLRFPATTENVFHAATATAAAQTVAVAAADVETTARGV